MYHASPAVTPSPPWKPPRVKFSSTARDWLNARALPTSYMFVYQWPGRHAWTTAPRASRYGRCGSWLLFGDMPTG